MKVDPKALREVRTHTALQDVSIDHHHDDDTLSTNDKKPIGVSVHYLRTTFKNDVAEYVKQQKEAQTKKPFFQKLISKKTSIQTKDISDINIYDIVEGVIKAKGKNATCPRDGKQGAAFVDCLEGEDNVGAANIMLSYAWGNSVDDIIDVLYRACMEKIKSDPKRTYVWICCLCNNQHRFGEEKTYDQMQAIFKAKVIGIGVVVALMAPHDNPIYVVSIGWIWHSISCIVSYDH